MPLQNIERLKNDVSILAYNLIDPTFPRHWKQGWDLSFSLPHSVCCCSILCGISLVQPTPLEKEQYESSAFVRLYLNKQIWDGKTGKFQIHLPWVAIYTT